MTGRPCCSDHGGEGFPVQSASVTPASIPAPQSLLCLPVLLSGCHESPVLCLSVLPSSVEVADAVLQVAPAALGL
eukprot:14152251-Heterocapsa_arctica.AAC.1